MNIKKIFSIFLILGFSCLGFQPVIARDFNIEPETLQEFLKTTEEIKIAYNWDEQPQRQSVNSAILLAARTPVTLRAVEDIKSSKIKSGDTVSFVVHYDVVNAEGMVIIKAGTPASAEIIFSKKRGIVGRPGVLQISNFHTTTVNGTYIPLMATMNDEPESYMASYIILSVFVCPVFLFIPGKDATINQGKTQVAYTNSHIYIDKSEIERFQNNIIQSAPLITKPTKRYSYQTPNITVE